MNISNDLRRYFVFISGGWSKIPSSLDSYLQYDSDSASVDKLPYKNGGPICWSIDSAFFGVKWFASPDHLGPCCPKMLNVDVPDQTLWPAESWALLDARDTVHMNGDRVVKLAFALHLRLALTAWSTRTADFDVKYRALPIGSSLRCSQVEMDPKNMDFEMAPNDKLYETLYSVERLEQIWSMEMPHCIDVNEFVADSRLDGAITLARINSSSFEHDGEFGACKWILKFTTGSNRNTRYHELKMLLSLKPHDNIASKPPFVVTVRAPRSDERLVCGFGQTFYEGGTLVKALPYDLQSPRLTLATQIAWCKAITSALVYIILEAKCFYSDLKTDNIMVGERDGQSIPVLIDFEMGRNLYNWAAPEVYYMEWIAELSHFDIMPTPNYEVPDSIRARADELCQALFAAKDQPVMPLKYSTEYENPPLGYYWPWLILTELQREYATVYMLGKVMWCIFEGVADGHNVLGRSTAEDGDQLFPEFRRTPERLRPFIKRCTAGAREWKDDEFEIVRIGGQIFPRSKTPGQYVQAGATLAETSQAVQAFWQDQFQKADSFISARVRWEKNEGSISDHEAMDFLKRPRLKEVLTFLEDFEHSYNDLNGAPGIVAESWASLIANWLWRK